MARRWLWVLAGSLAIACSLNPQPDLPGSNVNTGNTSGSSATPSGGKGGLNIGGGAAVTGGTASGGNVAQGGGQPSDAAGENAGGAASPGGSGGGGEGGESGESPLGAGHHG